MSDAKEPVPDQTEVSEEKPEVTETPSTQSEGSVETKQYDKDVDSVTEGIEAMSAKETHEKEIDNQLAAKASAKSDRDSSPSAEAKAEESAPSERAPTDTDQGDSAETATNGEAQHSPQATAPQQQSQSPQQPPQQHQHQHQQPLNPQQQQQQQRAMQQQQMQMQQQMHQQQMMQQTITPAQAQVMRQNTYENAKSEQRVSDADVKLFADFEKQKHVVLRKQRDEPLGFMITETSRSSLLPCIFVSHIFPGSVASKHGEFFVGDQIISVEGTSVVGLPFKKVLELFKTLLALEKIEFVVIPMDVVNQVTITRKPKEKLGFDVLHGEVVSVDTGGPADRAGLKAGYRIMAINGTSVVGVSHEKIVKTLAAAEVHLTTMHKDLYSTLVLPAVYAE